MAASRRASAQALYEGVAYSEEGQLLTASYQDYCVPRADDIPPIAVTLDDSAPCRTNPLGAKGCGESGAIGGPPCVTNGVMDALERTRHQAAQHAADAGQGLAGDQGCESGNVAPANLAVFSVSFLSKEGYNLYVCRCAGLATG